MGHSHRPRAYDDWVAGNQFRLEGDLAASERAYSKAIDRDPNFPAAYINRGAVRRLLGQVAHALADYNQAIEIDPKMSAAFNNRGNLLRQMDRKFEAVSDYQAAIALDPTSADALNNLAAILEETGVLQDALNYSRQALRQQPNSAAFWLQNGAILTRLGALEEAIAAFDAAIALNPGLTKAYANRGVAERLRGNPVAAIANAKQAIALDPTDAETHWNLSLAQLQCGQFEAGFSSYEWRKQKPQPFGRHPAPAPDWHGGFREDQSVLLYGEQGLGDTIQFSRYATLVARKVGRLVLEVPPQLVRLMSSIKSDVRVIATGADPGAISHKCALMSLPLAFETTVATIPAAIPYLRAEPENVARWRERIGSWGFKVGIVWQGNAQSPADEGRSMHLDALAPLANVAGVRLISLQKKTLAGNTSLSNASFPVDELGEDFDAGPDAFIDTAAAIENLDLVVSVDTAVAHLAGALGKPVWVALKVGADWRWLMEREDTPWYPTMRLYRQKSLGDWAEVMDRIAHDLRQEVEKTAGAPPTVNPMIPVSWGELFDKISILEIKSERMTSQALDNVTRELNALQAVIPLEVSSYPGVETLRRDLRAVNEALWSIEDAIRAKEAIAAFDADFIVLARSVYQENDKRALIKRRLNELLKSELKEEKCYASY